jgi:hypothetical protein
MADKVEDQAKPADVTPAAANTATKQAEPEKKAS